MKANSKLIFAFHAMLKGKSFRMNKEARAQLKADSTCNFKDTWWIITAINCDGCIDICGNLHSTFGNMNFKTLDIK